MNYKVESADEYLRRNRIMELFEDLCTKASYIQPDNLEEFLVEDLNIKQKQGQEQLQQDSLHQYSQKKKLKIYLNSLILKKMASLHKKTVEKLCQQLHHHKSNNKLLKQRKQLMIVLIQIDFRDQWNNFWVDQNNYKIFMLIIYAQIMTKNILNIIDYMGRPLTLSYLQHKIGSQSENEVKQLNLWGHDYEDVSLLTLFPNLQVLQLSKNKVGTLTHISKCKQLKELYLRGNNISGIQELELLRELYSLKVLNLIENPVVLHPDYKKTVLKYCMALEKLDEVDVKDSDRQQALETEIYQSIPIIVKPQHELIHESSIALAPGFVYKNSKGKSKKNYETQYIEIKQSPNQSTEKSSGQQRKQHKYEQKITQNIQQTTQQESIEQVNKYFLDVAFGLTKYLDKNALLCLQKALSEEIPEQL